MSWKTYNSDVVLKGCTYLAGTLIAQYKKNPKNYCHLINTNIKKK